MLCVCDRNSDDMIALKVPLGVLVVCTRHIYATPSELLQLRRCSIDRLKSTRPVRQRLKAD